MGAGQMASKTSTGEKRVTTGEEVIQTICGFCR